jgi:hypothetical protein
MTTSFHILSSSLFILLSGAIQPWLFEALSDKLSQNNVTMLHFCCSVLQIMFLWALAAAILNISNANSLTAFVHYHFWLLLQFSASGMLCVKTKAQNGVTLFSGTLCIQVGFCLQICP